MKHYLSLFIITTLLLTACNSHNRKYDTPPTEEQLHQVPNCAADGPECKQFNPKL